MLCYFSYQNNNGIYDLDFINNYEYIDIDNLSFNLLTNTLDKRKINLIKYFNSH